MVEDGQLGSYSSIHWKLEATRKRSINYLNKQTKKKKTKQKKKQKKERKKERSKRRKGKKP